MKIEAYKHYKLDNGDKVYVSEFRGSTEYWPFLAMYNKSPTGKLYIKEDGSTQSGLGDYNTPNLVEEWKEEKMFKVGDKVKNISSGYVVEYGPNEGKYVDMGVVTVCSGDTVSVLFGDTVSVLFEGCHHSYTCHKNEIKLVEDTKEVTTNEMSGRVTVDITDRIDEIIREDLEWNALQMLKEGNDKYEFIGNKAQLFSAFCEVIKYYSTKKQYEEFVAKTEGKKVE